MRFSQVDVFSTEPLLGNPVAVVHDADGLTDAQELRQVVIAGQFFGAGSASTYTLTLDQYGQPVTITKP